MFYLGIERISRSVYNSIFGTYFMGYYCIVLLSNFNFYLLFIYFNHVFKPYVLNSDYDSKGYKHHSLLLSFPV
jgi:hypothetical protein